MSRKIISEDEQSRQILMGDLARHWLSICNKSRLLKKTMADEAAALLSVPALRYQAATILLDLGDAARPYWEAIHQARIDQQKRIDAVSKENPVMSGPSPLTVRLLKLLEINLIHRDKRNRGLGEK